MNEIRQTGYTPLEEKVLWRVDVSPFIINPMLDTTDQRCVLAAQQRHLKTLSSEKPLNVALVAA